MLGSRFDLEKTLFEIASRNPVADTERDGMLGDHCAELERQMAEMARSVHATHPCTSVICPICDSRMHLNAERAHSEIAEPGTEQHGLECETCGLTTERSYDAVRGYRDLRR